jgi:hypothetical protein
MEVRCFDCGTPLNKVVNCCGEVYQCPKCELLWFGVTYKIICPVCGCNYDNWHDLVQLEHYPPRGYTETFVRCAHCEQLVGDDEG